MSAVGQSERATQNRVIALFKEELGYRYLGNWCEREGNSNIEEAHLSAYLQQAGYTAVQISKAIHQLRSEANNPNRDLYDNNKAVYGLLRYGAKVKVALGEQTEDVHFIDWRAPQANHFAIAEEVTLKGHRTRRPDVVLYVNGIAFGIIELKSSCVSIGDGIRQNLSNQSKEFNRWFYATVQFCFAGNDSEGLVYGTVGTPEKFYMRWKEDTADNTRTKIDKYLLKLCDKTRILELMHDFVLFDGGVRKLPRVHQYMAVKAAQAHVERMESGIIWHSQGTGKSIVMVLLAKWLLENKPNARVVLVTDRDALDKQIYGVFSATGEDVQRAASHQDLLRLLGQAKPRLLCSLVHKFGNHDTADFEAFIEVLEAQPCYTVGDVFVFVDECHRTQSGRLHRTMKVLMPHAVFFGFSGTPLLRKDRETSLEVFGRYIHRYQFAEAVADKVVLDLVYEARDIEQKLGADEGIDAWFEAKTQGLNEWQKAALRKQWGTLQKVLSSRSRMGRVVADIVIDFATKPRLSDLRGTAMLVAASIYEACRYYALFQESPLKGKCALITSYNLQTNDITQEDSGANTATEKEFVYTCYKELLKDVGARPNTSKSEIYEEEAKALFKTRPADMKLLIVVDKLLTGFDAPSCSYLYIDKSMQDHGLFQAICRTNRLDGDDKSFGHIIDYKDLFHKVENAIAVYNAELEREQGGSDPQILIHERLKKGRERLENAREQLSLLCFPVQPPQGELEHIHYFCGNTESAAELSLRAPRRVALYQATVGLLRAYAGIADGLGAAGYSDSEAAAIKDAVNHYVKLREVVRKASGESIDLKAYEADMRHLIDLFIEAEASRSIAPLDGLSLLDLIVKSGIVDAITSLPEGIKSSQEATTETIANNIRHTIIRDHLNDPAYYDRMSQLLGEIIKDLKARRLTYQEYLRKIAALAQQVQDGHVMSAPAVINTPGLRALYSNLGEDKTKAIAVDKAVKDNRPDGWRGDQRKEQVVKKAIWDALKNVDNVERDDAAEVERIFLIIKQHEGY